MGFRDYLIEKEVVTKEQLEEGKFVKDIPDNVVKKIMGDLEKTISASEEHTSDMDDEFGGSISRIKVQEYIEEFLKGLMTYGPMTKVDKKGKPNYKETTGYWITQIMNEIGLDTNKPKSMENFEKKLTVIAGKLLGKIK